MVATRFKFMAISLLATLILAAPLPAEAARVDKGPRYSVKTQRVLEECRTAYKRLRSLDEKDPRTDELRAEFQTLVRSIADKFPQATVTVDQFDEGATDIRPLPLKKYILNRYKIGFNAIRFTAPGENETFDLWWIFLTPQSGNMTWYILPVEDDFKGFSHYTYKRNVASGIPGAPRQNFLFEQGLPGGKIKSGQDYLLWFISDPDASLDIYVNIDLKRRPRPDAD